MQHTPTYERKHRKKTFLVNFFQPETLWKRKTKTSFILVVIHVDFFGLLKYYDKEPLHYKSPCGNHYVERSRFLCQRYIKSNWCNKLGERLRNRHLMIRLKYVIDMMDAVSPLWKLIFTANINHYSLSYWP